MENQDTKNSSKRTTSTEIDQVGSDFALAAALQEEERAFTMLETIENDGDEESDISEELSNDNDYEFFEYEGEQEFHEEQDSNDEEDMEEDDIDPDELSYEELIALGEIIGVERRGLSPKEISSCLHLVKFRFGESKCEVDRCVVCQVEYEEGETLGALCCEHLYHSECISKWLQMKKICPICSTEISSSINTNFS
ncbi:hypothetical protein SLA2020_466620 [Shorea laevis]